MVDVKASRFDRQGAFAAETIPQRLKIGEIGGESTSVARARHRAIRSERIMIVELSDRRAIALGEEITADYEPTHRDGQLACRCAL